MINEYELILSLSESTYIPAEFKQCVENIGTTILVIVEVQTGGDVGENDVVRFGNIYRRVECIA